MAYSPFSSMASRQAVYYRGTVSDRSRRGLVNLSRRNASPNRSRKSKISFMNTTIAVSFQNEKMALPERDATLSEGKLAGARVGATSAEAQPCCRAAKLVR
jgi:hypothetical protein